MKNYFIALALLITCYANAQTNYSVYAIPYNPHPFVSGTLITDIDIYDDQYSHVIPIGFSFIFFGASYDSLIISPNGFINFNTSYTDLASPWQVEPLPIDTLFDISNSILAPWQDMNLAYGGQISYQLYGIAPYRRFVVSYFEIAQNGCELTLFSQQIVLFETTNIIETHIKDRPFCNWPISNPGGGVHGIVNQAGDIFITVPGRNGTVWTTQNEGMRFDPGAMYNTQNNLITGNIFQDLNGDCIKDTNELGIANCPVLVNEGMFYTYSDDYGNYTLHVDSGTNILEHYFPPYYNIACPSTGSYTINFTAPFDTSNNNYFVDSVLYYCSDLKVDIGTTNFTSCLNEWVGINYCNNGTVIDTAVVINFSLNDSLQILYSASNIMNLGNNNYSVEVGQLNPGQCGNISFFVQVGCDTLGTVYCMNATIVGATAFDCDVNNNISMDCHSLIGSFDPNDLQVASQQFNQEGFVTADDIDDNDELTYLIRFQNTGTDTAFQVQVRDTIPSQLNPASIVPGAASHNYNWLVLNGELIIDFININLPDSITNEANSHGFVKFKIKQNAGNLPGTVIANQASIYFDANPAVITNQTFNTIPLPTGLSQQSLQEVLYMPNPVKDQLQLVLPFENVSNTSIEFIDVLGKNVLAQSIENKVSQINCMGLSKGIYMVRIVQNGLLYSHFKIIKE
jgi:uncharacterized repeat protein (TIGR01451 family)